MMSDANNAALLSQAQGARWHRNPDGSWMRWSYLGEDWEKADAPAPLLAAVEMKPGENYWMVSPHGGWMPYDPSKPPEQQTLPSQQSEALPPAEQQASTAAHEPARLNPDFVEKPQWTAEWTPGWKQEFKKP